MMPRMGKESTLGWFMEYTIAEDIRLCDSFTYCINVTKHIKVVNSPMKKKKIILDIVGKAIEKHGFIHDFKNSGSGFWDFVREVDSISPRQHGGKVTLNELGQRLHYHRENTAMYMTTGIMKQMKISKKI